MRAYLPDFKVISPRDLAEALDALSGGGSIVPLAGGTDLMVYLDSGTLAPCTFLNLQTVQEFHTPVSIGSECLLGPLATFRHARVIPAIRAKFPLLSVAAREVGVLAVQSRATWAGNIANASPAADGVPALMAYDARLELTSRRGSRQVRLEQFYSGYKKLDLQPGELITGINVPLPQPGWRDYYRKVGSRRFQAISKVVFAGRILGAPDGMVQDVRIVVGSVAPYTLRARETETVLRGRSLTPEIIAEAGRALQDEIHPIDDIRSTAAYRRRITANLLRDFLYPALRQ